MLIGNKSSLHDDSCLNNSDRLSCQTARMALTCSTLCQTLVNTDVFNQEINHFLIEKTVFISHRAIGASGEELSKEEL